MDAGYVEAGFGRRRHRVGHRFFPATVVEVVGGQAQGVAAAGVSSGVLPAEAVYSGAERRATYHPGAVVDELAVLPVGRRVADGGAAFFGKGPGRQQAVRGADPSPLAANRPPTCPGVRGRT